MSVASAPESQRLFGDRLDRAVEYADILITDGVTRGLIGPREAPRIWERHLLNCAAVAELIPAGATVIDVGSGAGLPGVVLAIARPDLRIVLVEPLARRAVFLEEVVGRLGLERTSVVRARAEECAPKAVHRANPRAGPLPADVVTADVVTARAVASLDRLAAWCLPLTTKGGRMLALKGESAAEEIAAHRDAVMRSGGSEPSIRLCGVGLVSPPTTVVEVTRVR